VGLEPRINALFTKGNFHDTELIRFQLKSFTGLSLIQSTLLLKKTNQRRFISAVKFLRFNSRRRRIDTFNHYVRLVPPSSSGRTGCVYKFFFATLGRGQLSGKVPGASAVTERHTYAHTYDGRWGMRKACTVCHGLVNYNW
jgi:hypothetical protein